MQSTLTSRTRDVKLIDPLKRISALNNAGNFTSIAVIPAPFDDFPLVQTPRTDPGLTADTNFVIASQNASLLYNVSRSPPQASQPHNVYRTPKNPKTLPFFNYANATNSRQLLYSKYSINFIKSNFDY